MRIPKNYFHDRIILLLLSVNAFLTLLCALLVLLRLDVGRPGGYIVQYRSSLGLSAFKSGNASALASFALFALFVFVFHTLLSMRVYPIRRPFALVVLSMGLLLLILAIIVSNALLVLR